MLAGVQQSQITCSYVQWLQNSTLLAMGPTHCCAFEAGHKSYIVRTPVYDYYKPYIYLFLSLGLYGFPQGPRTDLVPEQI